MNIQGLTLMMAVVVYAAPLQKDVKQQLKEIIENAKLLKNKSMDMDVQVPMLTEETEPTCVHEFFCLAEKALNKTDPKISNPESIKLNVLLHLYNKNSSIHCSRNPLNRTYSLGKFLDDVVTCSTQVLRQIHNNTRKE